MSDVVSVVGLTRIVDIGGKGKNKGNAKSNAASKCEISKKKTSSSKSAQSQPQVKFHCQNIFLVDEELEDGNANASVIIVCFFLYCRS